jgi:hypothetical protein
LHIISFINFTEKQVVSVPHNEEVSRRFQLPTEVHTAKGQIEVGVGEYL